MRTRLTFEPMKPPCSCIRGLSPVLFRRTRIYFLSTPSNGWETTLLYVDIAHADHANGYRLHWQPVIEANFQR